MMNGPPRIFLSQSLDSIILYSLYPQFFIDPSCIKPSEVQTIFKQIKLNCTAACRCENTNVNTHILCLHNILSSYLILYVDIEKACLNFNSILEKLRFFFSKIQVTSMPLSSTDYRPLLFSLKSTVVQIKTTTVCVHILGYSSKDKRAGLKK